MENEVNIERPIDDTLDDNKKINKHEALDENKSDEVIDELIIKKSDDQTIVTTDFSSITNENTFLSDVEMAHRSSNEKKNDSNEKLEEAINLFAGKFIMRQSVQSGTDTSHKYLNKPMMRLFIIPKVGQKDVTVCWIDRETGDVYRNGEQKPIGTVFDLSLINKEGILQEGGNDDEKLEEAINIFVDEFINKQTTGDGYTDTLHEYMNKSMFRLFIYNTNDEEITIGWIDRETGDVYRNNEEQPIGTVFDLSLINEDGTLKEALGKKRKETFLSDTKIYKISLNDPKFREKYNELLHLSPRRLLTLLTKSTNKYEKHIITIEGFWRYKLLLDYGIQHPYVGSYQTYLDVLSKSSSENLINHQSPESCRIFLSKGAKITHKNGEALVRSVKNESLNLINTLTSEQVTQFINNETIASRLFTTIVEHLESIPDSLFGSKFINEILIKDQGGKVDNKAYDYLFSGCLYLGLVEIIKQLVKQVSFDQDYYKELLSRLQLNNRKKLVDNPAALYLIDNILTYSSLDALLHDISGKNHDDFNYIRKVIKDKYIYDELSKGSSNKTNYLRFLEGLTTDDATRHGERLKIVLENKDSDDNDIIDALDKVVARLFPQGKLPRKTVSDKTVKTVSRKIKLSEPRTDKEKYLAKLVINFVQKKPNAFDILKSTVKQAGIITLHVLFKGTDEAKDIALNRNTLKLLGMQDAILAGDIGAEGDFLSQVITDYEVRRFVPEQIDDLEVTILPPTVKVKRESKKERKRKVDAGEGKAKPQKFRGEVQETSKISAFSRNTQRSSRMSKASSFSDEDKSKSKIVSKVPSRRRVAKDKSDDETIPGIKRKFIPGSASDD